MIRPNYWAIIFDNSFKVVAKYFRTAASCSGVSDLDGTLFNAFDIPPSAIPVARSIALKLKYSLERFKNFFNSSVMRVKITYLTELPKYLGYKNNCPFIWAIGKDVVYLIYQTNKHKYYETL